MMSLEKRLLRDLAIIGKIPIDQTRFRTGIFFYFLGYAHFVSGPYQKNSSIKNILSTVFVDIAYHFQFSPLNKLAPPFQPANQTLVACFTDCLVFNLRHSCRHCCEGNTI